MALLKQYQLDKFETYTIGSYYIDPFQTTNAVQQTVGSFPVAQNQIVGVLTYEASAVTASFNGTVEANMQASFVRGAGNVSRTSTTSQTGLVRNIFTSAGLLNTISIDAVANTSTQEIDFKVTGQAATTLNWNFLFRIKFSN